MIIRLFGISQEGCLLFLKLLDNADKAKQDRCGAITSGRWGQGVARRYKTNWHHLGRRGCTES